MTADRKVLVSQEFVDADSAAFTSQLGLHRVWAAGYIAHTMP